MSGFPEDFTDVLKPRREDFSTVIYFLQEHNAKVAHRQTNKPSSEKHKIEVLRSSKIRNLILNLCQANNVPQKVIEGQVAAILEEIGFKMNLNVIRLLGIILTKICIRTCTSVFVNETKLLKVAISMGNVPLVLVPSHRSYADFVLMSYILYLYNIAIPTTAAGMDFHGMKGIGEMLRNTGAFFMRRSYGQDQLYWEVFRQYMHQLVTRSDAPLQYFVEGTRSRSNKSLSPKFGLLFMTLRPFLIREVPDLMFVPVNATYDRILEEKLFAFELLGVPKPKESTSAFFKSLKIINENYGKVYMNFGDPIYAKQWFNGKIDRELPRLEPLHAQELSNQEKRVVSQFAQEIIFRQQKLCVITTFNLVALVITLNLNKNSKVTLQKLLEEVVWFRSILKVLGASVDIQNVQKDVKDALEVHKNLVKVNEKQQVVLTCDEIKLDAFDKTQLKGHDLSESTMSFAVPHVMLQLYVNPVLHYLIDLMIFGSVLAKRSDRGISEGEFLHDFHFLRSVFSYEFVACGHLLEMEIQNALVHALNMEIIVKDNLGMLHSGKNKCLIDALDILLKPFMYCYMTVLNIILKCSSEAITEKMICTKTQAEVEQYLKNPNKKYFVHAYALSLDTIKNCVANLVSQKVLVRQSRNNRIIYHFNVELLENVRQRFSSFVPDVWVVNGSSQYFKNKL